MAGSRCGRWLPRFAALAVSWGAPLDAQLVMSSNLGPTAGEFVHEVWTIEHGLPVNQVTAVLQARDGYLWLATFDGLVRFDGVRFTVYTTGTHAGLPSNRIVGLHEAADGALWLIHEYSWVTRYHDGAFTSFGPGEGLRGSRVRTIHEGPPGTIWIGTDLDVAAYRDGRMTPLARDALGTAVVTLHRDRGGALWIGTLVRGLYRFENGRFTQPDAELATGGVEDFFEMPDGTLWVAATGGVYRRRIGAVERIPSPPLTARRFVGLPGGGAPLVAANEDAFRYRDGRLEPLGLEGWAPGFLLVGTADAAGNVWLTSRGRLFRGAHPILEDLGEIRGLVLDHEGSLWIAARGLHRLKPALFRVYGAEEGAVDNVYPVHEDPDGTLWFGSMGWGLARFVADRFTVYSTLAGGLPGQLVLAIHRDADDDLWVGAYGGSFCRFQPGRPCERPPGLGGQNVRAIHRDRGGTLWAGTDVGLFWMRDGAMQPPPGAAELAGRVVRVIHESADGAVWFGTNGAGLLRYRPESAFEPFTTAQGLSSDLIRSLYEDAQGVLWVGTEGRGLNRLELPPNGDLAGARVTVYRQRDGLYEEVIHQILEDDFGRLWMSSNRGIFWVERAELEAFARGEISRIRSTHYTERDGLRNREANGGVNSAGVKARDGRLWFATQAGVAMVDPATIRRNTVAPPVVIEGVTVGGVTYPAGGDTPIRLPAGRRDLEITYTALSFLAPENVRFRYRLVGLDEEWVQPGNRRTAFYTKVPPGHYTFQVIASNNDDVWNETGATLLFEVPPFVHETAWFRGLAILLVLGAVAGGVGLRVRGLRRREHELRALVVARTRELQREKEASEVARREAERHSAVAERARTTVEAQAQQLQELDRAKSRFFANISHEFRTPLTLMIGPLEDLRAGLHGAVSAEIDGEVSVALRNARRLLHLVDQLLDVARLEAHRMEVRAQPGDLVALLKDLLLGFSPVAERKRIGVRLDEPSSPALVYFDSDLMEKVFVNILGNAFKYTPEGGAIRVFVRATVPVAGHPDFADMPEGHVTVEVKDSGPGIAAADRERIFERFFRASATEDLHGGTGIGLSLARELVELHHGRIDLVSEEGFGAAFTVTLPLGSAHFERSQLAAADGAALRDRPAARQPVVELAESPEALPGGTAPAAAADEDDRPTVLLIDDNVELRAFVTKHLRAGGYRAVEAADGAEGLALARELVPDCVISDIMMPGLDGHALCRALKADRALDFVPVILLTARADREHKLEGLAEGADDYLTKPFDMSELLARIENLMVSRQRLRERLRVRVELHPAPMEAPSNDEVFLRRVREVLEAHLADEAFGVDDLARAVGQSRSQLYRRMQEIVGQSPSELLLRFRVERGADLLAAHAGTVSEIAYAVGFKSVSHFCRRFRARYGVTPSAYAGAAARTTPDA